VKKLRYPPKRRLANELYSLATILWIPVAVALVFPFGAFTFRPAAIPPAPPASCAFVELTAAESAAALASARAALKTGDGGISRHYADLSIDALPITLVGGVAEMPMTDAASRAPLAYMGVPLPVTMKADRPKRLVKEPSEDKDAFPRESLLDAKIIPENKPQY
jgi:hypothetical protein